MNLAQYLAATETGLIKYLDKTATNSPTKETKLLINRLKKVITAGGKRFRPALFFLIHQAYGGKKDAINIGIAIELLHQALLIHDDLIDQDIVRHSQPNIVGLYLKDKTKASNVPDAMGILAGDITFSLLTRLIIEDGNLSSSNKLKIINLLHTAIIDTVYGEQLDSLNVNGYQKKFDEVRQQEIHALKTASYSTLLPTKTAALLTNLNAKEFQKLTDFASTLGVYYQLANDYNDYFITSRGNDILKDFRTGKLTYPYYVAQKYANNQDLKRLSSLFSKGNLTKAQILEVTAILNRTNAKQASEDYLNSHYTKSVNKLGSLGIKEYDKAQLLALIDSLKV